MMKLIVLLILSVLVYANARHIHPHGAESHGKHHDVEEMWNNDEEKSAALKEELIVVELEEVPRHLKPNRFVPLNNDFFFMGHVPCAEEGFKRDYMGICRDVWD